MVIASSDKGMVHIDLNPQHLSLYRLSVKEALKRDELELYAQNILVLYSLSQDLFNNISIKDLVSMYGFEKVQWVLAAKVIEPGCAYNDAIVDWALSIIADIPLSERAPYSAVRPDLALKIPSLIKELYTLFIKEVNKPYKE